jgi:hypothetical protein
MTNMERMRDEAATGAALASFLAVGIGTFALGLIVILNEAGLFSVPAVYGPAGGVSGRTTLAAAIWLVTWAALHRRWNERQPDTRRVFTVTLVLIGLGVLLTFPPIWRLVAA